MSLHHYEAPIREPLVLGEKSYHDVTEDIVAPILGKANKSWWAIFTIALIAFVWGLGCIVYLVSTGIGTRGLNKTIGWAWDITNFVWWVGIGHAGTLISAVLLLFRQKWRMGVNRSAEAMTIFAVVQAGLFPLIHMGRIWLAYWVLPIPNQFGSLWINFNSPLLWDVFAIATYLSISLVFWYTGLLPDFAMVRDRTKNEFQRKVYGILSFGWSGRVKDWQRWEEVHLVLAGLATPLVLSVHTTVSFDFATSVVPGWHSNIYPPYFVAGAVFSGFAMVQTLLIVMRKVLHMEEYITMLHIEYMNKVILVVGGIVSVAYATEYFIAWYSGSEYENYTYLSFGAATGPYWWAFWSLIICNSIAPLFFFIKKVRRNIFLTYIIALLINIGMWFERFNIIVVNLSHDRLPSGWAMFSPTFVDIGVFIGTIGFFSVLFLLYARTFPVIPQAEIKSILKSSGEYYKARRAVEGEGAMVLNPGTELPSRYKIGENVSNKTEVKAIEEILNRIGAYNPEVDTPDDLQKITGLGPIIEKDLNKLGIHTYDQVSKLEEQDYLAIEALIPAFSAETAKTENWAGQALNLKNNKL